MTYLTTADLRMMALTWGHTKGLRRNKITIFLFILLLSFPYLTIAQPKESVGVMFYNVENLFDIKDDSLKLDNEFTPNGDKHWTYAKYFQKLKNISRVIYEAGEWNPPAILGLCEVENHHVLNDLLWKTGLQHSNYQIIHHESPDERGIDVALLYRKDIFTPLESIPIKVDFGKNTRPTRDILYVFGLIKDTIPLHIFVAHFPSRYGGVQNTKPLRFKAAQILNDTIKSIYQHDTKANIIAMGDFNDEPQDESILELTKDIRMKNISAYTQSFGGSKGSLKHQYEWNLFDQFIISEHLSDTTKTPYINSPMKIMDFPFLLETDKTYTGIRPYRTYIGYKYNNGFSDHLPIWLTLTIKD